MKRTASAPTVKQGKPVPAEIFGTWIAAYDAGDVNKLLSIFDADLRYIAPCQPVQDLESLANWYRFDFKLGGPRPTWTFVVDSVDVSGDLAVIVSHWTGVTNYGGFSANIQRLRSIDFLRFGEQGWKIFRTINDAEPCAAPGASRQAKKGPKASKKK